MHTTYVNEEEEEKEFSQLLSCCCRSTYVGTYYILYFLLYSPKRKDEKVPLLSSVLGMFQFRDKLIFLPFLVGQDGAYKCYTYYVREGALRKDV